MNEQKLQECCDLVVFEIAKAAGSNTQKMLSLLANITINTLIQNDICPSCYIKNVMELFNEVAGQYNHKDTQHFDGDFAYTEETPLVKH